MGNWTLYDMEDVNKVFHSEIIRGHHQPCNNLYDLFNRVSATPLELNDINKNATPCNFIPRADKTYIPKRIPRNNKVKTVRDIRASFESDTYAYLTKDLETQQNCILKQIRHGFSKNDRTLKIVKKVLKADFPVSRSTWHMITNINPENHTHNRQFVLWNRKLIQVNGSTGGKNKLICDYDLTTKLSKIRKRINNTNISRRKGLLRHSLDVKFKPGPLGKKKFLDYSYQKYNGDIELVNIPRIGLEIQPTYGITLEPTIMSFLNNLREGDGTMSQKWAEFAVSVLGKIEKSNAKLLNAECLTFDLNYKYDQHRILMRKYLDSTCTAKHQNMSLDNNCIKDQLTTFSEIKYVMSQILDAVEVSIEQDNMFTPDDDLHEVVSENSQSIIDTATPSKEKVKRKYNELDRLDVTVIRLPDNLKKEQREDCGNLFCALGCVCDSINTTYNIKQHCGREECMFECKCDFSKYTAANSLDDDGYGWIPAIIGIENEINMRLAKEEQKFHQTVIMTGEKNILLKSERRNWKASKKYDNFYKNMCLKRDTQKKPVLSVTALKINCENVEPWCMVHNLYKCFCKGKITESSIPIPNIASKPLPIITNVNNDYSSDKTQKLIMSTSKSLRPRVRTDSINSDKQTKGSSLVDKSSSVKGCNIAKTCKSVSTCNKEETRKEIRDSHTDITPSENINLYEFYHSDYNNTCSRLIPYEGRKYSDGHYKNTNLKIKEMEKNDKTLHQRMMNTFKTDVQTRKTPVTKKDSENTPIVNSQVIANNQVENLDVQLENLVRESADSPNFVEFFYDNNGMTSNENDKSQRKLLFRENKLVTWLESNYKLYKKRTDNGLVKTTLEPPKLGKFALHSWDFILSRYRERKNLFLISKQSPYRIFLGVNTKYPFFQNCMNINDIRFADLHKYPQTVKNLLTNATNLKDNFCILRGSAHCWELCGSVAKLSNTDENAIEISNENSDLESNFQYENNEEICNELGIPVPEDVPIHISEETKSQNVTGYSKDGDSSKWFVMTVENDFDEIRFYKRGFFVKYESILKATDVARVTGKTVRLSSQKCVAVHNGPQFGVYAIPNASEYCVFIGPYELQDSLGIETVKSMSNLRTSQKTRGFWITTNKVDNLKVIDNPLSFVTLTDIENKESILLENNLNVEKNSLLINSPETSYSEDSDIAPKKSLRVISSIKKVKPITIRKPKGFYQMTRTGSLNRMLQSPSKQLTYSQVLNSNLRIGSNDVMKNLLDDMVPNDSREIEHVTSSTDDNVSAQDDLQIKITAVYSQKEEQSTSKNEKKGSMFILKPEEINRKLITETLSAGNITFNSNVDDETSSSEAMDIDSENSDRLATCTVDSDVFVISDDDDSESSDGVTSPTSEIRGGWKDVLIQCTSVSDLACVRGRQMPESRLLSFKVPGGLFSSFYPEPEALKKLNQELSVTIGASKSFNLSWKVVDAKDEIFVDNVPNDLVFWRGISPDIIAVQDDELESIPVFRLNRAAAKPKWKIKKVFKRDKNSGPRILKSFGVVSPNLSMSTIRWKRDAKRVYERKKTGGLRISDTADTAVATPLPESNNELSELSN